MTERLSSYYSMESGDWEDAWNDSLEESEETGGDYLPGSDESDDVSKGSEGRETSGLLNGEYMNGHSGRDSPVHGLDLPTASSRYPRPQHLKTSPNSYSQPVSRAESRNSSSNHRSSCSSIDFDSPGFHSEGSKPRLKPTSTSPAALNSIATTEGELSDISPRLTPTHSNFDDRQLIGPSMGISYHPHNNSLQLRNENMMSRSSNSSLTKQGSLRKKKRSGSWYNVLSPSYKQKNEAFHKFFKDLPSSERLLVDYTCAMVKDILVQGRLYVSQNYLCFHSNILKWQTAVTVKLVDIDQMTKEKTVKVIPNAIQFLMKDKTKTTFTSFTARDRAYLLTFRLWQNALLDKPMTAHELWTQIHSNYGEELGLCSSDDDYVRPENMPPRKHQSFGEGDGGTTTKLKRKKKLTNSTQTPHDDEYEKLSRRRSTKSTKSSPSTGHSSQESNPQFQQESDSYDKSIHSSQCSHDDVSIADDVIQDEEGVEDVDGDESPLIMKDSRSRKMEEQAVDEENDEPADFTLPDCNKVSLNSVYETSARDMYRIIFGEENECAFWKDTLVNKGTTQIDFGRWTDDDEVKGQKIRHLSYTLRLDNPIGPKTSHCKEKQILYPSTVEGKSYGIDCVVQNYGIPYADYFYTCMRYCIRKVTRDTCEVRVTSELRYKKTPWGLVKNFIEKNVASGLTQNFRKLAYQLKDQVDYEKSQPQTEDKNRKNSNLRRRKRRSETGNDTKTKGSRSSSSLSNENGRVQSSLQNRSDVNNNKGSLTPSRDSTSAVPSLHIPNGYIPSSRSYEPESPRLHFFGQGGKFIIGAILFIFILLVYSNYSMYQRLTTLEQVTAAAATADGVDPSVTAALLDRPGVPISSNPEMMSTYLQAIDKRLRRLEDSMVKFAETSGSKWEKMERDWAALQKMLQTILQHQLGNSG
ncbi:protein Aster-A-like isoform X2 [Styela clava]